MCVNCQVTWHCCFTHSNQHENTKLFHLCRCATSITDWWRQTLMAMAARKHNGVNKEEIVNSSWESHTSCKVAAGCTGWPSWPKGGHWRCSGAVTHAKFVISQTTETSGQVNGPELSFKCARDDWCRRQANHQSIGLKFKMHQTRVSYDYHRRRRRFHFRRDVRRSSHQQHQQQLPIDQKCASVSLHPPLRSTEREGKRKKTFYSTTHPLLLRPT